MNDLIILVVVIIFPILIYLLFSSLSILINRKISYIMFIITIFTSLYFCISFCTNDISILFVSIPVLLCYLKKERLLGILLSIIIGIYCYLYDIIFMIIIFNLILYFLVYLFTNKLNKFNYIYLYIVFFIQIIFLIILYILNIDYIVNLMVYLVIIYFIIFFCLYLFKIAIYITNLYEMVNEIEKINNLKDSLFKLTHEVKNPIAVCKGYLDMIDLNNIDKSKKYINIIKSEIDRSLNIISDFMEYSKIKINRDIFDLNVLLDSVNDAFLILFEKNNIKFNYINDYEDIYMNGDYERIKQVIVNIIKNSIESISNGGTIDMVVNVIDGFVLISIKDSGMGMNKDELKNLFKMFYTTKKNGTGLGISLSKEIIDAHNGSIKYESEKGKGTNCIISIPL